MIKTFNLKANQPLSVASTGRYLNILIAAGTIKVAAYGEGGNKFESDLYKGCAPVLEAKFDRFEFTSGVDQQIKVWISQYPMTTQTSEVRRVGSENITAHTAALDYTKPQEIAPAEAGRGRVIVQPKTECFIGGANINTDNSIKLAANETLALNTQGAVYGLSTNPDHKITMVPNGDKIAYQHDIESPYRNDGQTVQIGKRIYYMANNSALQSKYSDDGGHTFLPLPLAGGYAMYDGNAAGAWGITNGSYNLHIYKQDETQNPEQIVFSKTDIDPLVLNLECVAINRKGQIAVTGMISGGRVMWISLDGATFERVQKDGADFLPCVYHGVCAVGDEFAAMSSDKASMCIFSSAEITEEYALNYAGIAPNNNRLWATDEGVIYYVGVIGSIYDMQLCWLRKDSGGGVTQGRAAEMHGLYNNSGERRCVAVNGSAVMCIKALDSFGQGGKVYYKENHAAEFVLIGDYTVDDNLASPNTLFGCSLGEVALAGIKYHSGELVATGGGRVAVVREVN